MSTTFKDAEDEVLTKELETLRLLRATLESVKQLVDNIHTDVSTLSENADTVTALSERWSTVIAAASEVGENEGGKGKGKEKV